MLSLLVALLILPLAPKASAPPATKPDAVAVSTSTDLQKVIKQLRARVGEDAGVDAVIKLDMGKSGSVSLDGKSTPNTVSTEAKNADTTIKLSLDQLQTWLGGKLSITAEAKAGRLSIEGDMGVAMTFDKLAS